MEIKAAAKWIERECGSIETDELTRELARLLGFKRAGAGLRQAIRDALERSSMNQ